MQIIAPARIYPVIVIGSGASGGMAAWNLTRQGIDVLLLDAGDKFDRAKYWTHVRPWQAQEREARGERPETFFLDTKEQPYLTPAGRPFALTRVWGHGGKTNVWGRVSLRYSQMDLKASERDGWEIPWPISYADISPYYDQVEQLIGVCGGTDDSEALPGSKFLQPPPGPRCGERLLQRGMTKLGIPVVAGRRANMTRPTRGFPRLPLLRQLRRRMRHGILLLLGRSPAALRDEDRQARDPLERGRRAHSHRRHGPRHRRAVLRSAHRAEQQVRGKVVVLGASCVDSTRILLNSKSERHANGLGNGSDVIGRYLCEQIRLNVTGYLPALVGHSYAERPRDRRRAHLHAALQPSVPAAAATTCVDSGRSSGTPARASMARMPVRSGCPASARRSRPRSSAGIRPGSRFIPSARCCRTRTTASRWIRRASIATAFRCRASTTGSVKTNAR